MTVKLSEIAEINPRLTEFVEQDAIVSFLGMADVDARSGTTTSGVDREFCEVAKGYTQFVDGDLLLAKITPCFENGKIAQANLRHVWGAGSTEFHVIRPDRSQVDQRYLLHYLRQPRIRIAGERRMTGSAGQRRVPENFITNLEVPLPSLENQRRIAEALDRADALRAKRRAAIALLGDLARSIFLDIFGSPARNPRRWPEIPLAEGIVEGPQNGLYKAASHYGSGVPIVRIDAFYGGAITDIGSLKRVEVSNVERERFALAPGDILINRVNSLEYLGKSALVPEIVETTVFESNMMRFRVDEEVILPKFLVQLLQSKSIKSQILSGAKNAVNQSSINQKDVGALRVFVPPIDLQREYVARMECVDRCKVTGFGQLTKLDALFDSLQDGAFRGELWEG
jgi:type I restriction enzyme, S subunit